MYKVSDPPPFNPDEPYDDVMASKKIRFFQNGHYYSARGTYRGTEVKPPNLTVEIRKQSKKQVKKGVKKETVKQQRAASLLGDLSVPKEVMDAERENARAKHAEELAG